MKLEGPHLAEPPVHSRPEGSPEAKLPWTVSVLISARADLVPGYLWQCLGHFLIVMTGRTTGTSWVEARDAVTHSTMHTTVS